MENIALAFSGGGFRAAAFSTGCISYLNKVKYNGRPLLQNVKFISSTSGGSITNLLYSAYTYEGKSFDEFYKDLCSALEGEKLLAAALHNLNKPKAAWKGRPDKNVNAINAFSLAYDDFLKQREFSLFSNRQQNPHLEEICVNSTEFTNGYAFRFQSQDNSTAGITNGLIGNKNIFFNKEGIEFAEKIKLADILASSSCFPSGFEPMIFPHDYTRAALSKEDLLKGLSFTANAYSLPHDNYNNTDFMEDENFKKEIQFGIMDGGVADNQAIDAFMLADKRRVKDGRKKFDLFMSCDVTSYLMDGYTLPVAKKKWYDFISFNTAKWFAIIIFSLIALWLPLSLIYFFHCWHWWNTVSAAVSAVFFIPGSVWLLKKIFSPKQKKAGGTWELVFKKYMGVFTGMGLGGLKQLLMVRAKSVFILANDVYLKQIRRLYYERLYSDPNYKDRVIQNAIYDLSRAKFPAGVFHVPEKGEPPVPSDMMIAVAEKARTMGTTLWFDANHEKENIKNCIIATGQFGTCYNLLSFISKMQTKTPAIILLEKELSEDYAAFMKNPMMMVEKQ